MRSYILRAAGAAVLSSILAGPANAATVLRPPVVLMASATSNPVTIIAYTVPTSNSTPVAITLGPDDDMWFTEYMGAKVGHITPTGTIKEHRIGTSGIAPIGITRTAKDQVAFGGNLPNFSDVGLITNGRLSFVQPTAPTPASYYMVALGNAVWFTLTTAGAIGKLQGGVYTYYTVPTPNCFPNGIAVGPDGNIWFTEYGQCQNIGVISPTTGKIVEYPVPGATAQPNDITSGSDGALWFTGVNNAVGRVTTSGVITLVPLSGLFIPTKIVTGGDGNMWFTNGELHVIARMTTAGKATSYAIPPSSGSDGYMGIARGPGRSIWFTNASGNQILKLTY